MCNEKTPANLAGDNFFIINVYSFLDEFGTVDLINVAVDIEGTRRKVESCLSSLSMWCYHFRLIALQSRWIQKSHRCRIVKSLNCSPDSCSKDRVFVVSRKSRITNYSLTFLYLSTDFGLSSFILLGGGDNNFCIEGSIGLVASPRVPVQVLIH